MTEERNNDGGFNPCFSGRYSATSKLLKSLGMQKYQVSILVLVEGTLQLGTSCGSIHNSYQFQSLF